MSAMTAAPMPERNLVLVPDPEPIGERTRINGRLKWAPLPYMDQFLTEMRQGEDARSEEYLRPVRVGLSHFADFVHAEGIRHPSDLDRTHIMNYKAHLTTLRKVDGSPYAASYQQQMLKYLRTWINWMVESGYIEEVDTPWRRIRIGTTRKLPNPLDDGEIFALFDAHRREAFQLPPFQWHRQEVILTLLFGWALRVHELEAINCANVDARLGFVRVLNKGGGQKDMPYSQAMKDVIGRYLRVRGSRARPGEDALLITLDGDRLSGKHIRTLVSEMGRRANIRVHPHMLRDTAATKMVDSDVSMERIMRFLGHTNMTSTMGYAAVRNKKIAESHDRVMTPLLEMLLGQRPLGEDTLGEDTLSEDEDD